MSKTMSRAFGCPQKYIQGPGELINLPVLAAQYGNKPFFVIDSGVLSLMYDKLAGAYAEAGKCFEYMSFSGESCRENIDLIKEKAKGSGCDIIVGFGGGKCLDAAKFASSELDWPRIIMPTSASTDAPAAGISVLYTKDGVHIRSEKMRRPTELVLIDSEIIANAPARLFSAGIGDALATYFEAMANDTTEGMNFIGTGYRRCRAGMAIARECYDILMTDGESALMAVKGHYVTEALENVIEANTAASALKIRAAPVRTAYIPASLRSKARMRTCTVKRSHSACYASSCLKTRIKNLSTKLCAFCLRSIFPSALQISILKQARRTSASSPTTP